MTGQWVTRSGCPFMHKPNQSKPSFLSIPFPFQHLAILQLQTSPSSSSGQDRPALAARFARASSFGVTLQHPRIIGGKDVVKTAKDGDATPPVLWDFSASHSLLLILFHPRRGFRCGGVCLTFVREFWRRRARGKRNGHVSGKSVFSANFGRRRAEIAASKKVRTPFGDCGASRVTCPSKGLNW